MKGIVCKVCGYISIDGSAPDKCPVCGAPKASFEERDALKTPVDKSSKSESEKKHVPAITVVKKCGLVPEGCVDVHVRVGEILHPMQAEHFIGHIDFYIDQAFSGRAILAPVKTNPAVAMHLKASGKKLTVIAMCNLHGNWISEVDI